MEEVLGLIPARGGSKGVPGKHLVALAGKPLLAYTCEAARKATALTRVIVSTDDEMIAQCARRYAVEVPFLRPPDLATDTTPMLDVVRYVLETLRHTEAYQPDVVVLLQPTSPLRRAEHIDAAVRLLMDRQADSVVSVVEVPHQFNPHSLLQRESSGTVTPYRNGPQPLRRQEKSILYARNGPAVLAVRAQVVREQGSLYGQTSYPLMMSREESVDIDEPSDLALAEYVLSKTPGA